MEFAFKARDANGILTEGQIQAASTTAAASELHRRGVHLLALSEIQPSRDPVVLLTEYLEENRKISLDELIIFARQMHALSRAGIPIIRAMRGLSESSSSPKLRSCLADIANKLEGGVNLASCLQDHPKVFSELFVAMVHVGENTGGLDQAFHQLSENLELERNARQKVKQAVRYPTMVVVALGIAMFVVNIWVIPAFSSVFEKLGSNLPLPTQILVATSDFFVNFWWLVIIILVTGAISFMKWIATEQGDYRWSEWQLKIPIIGPMLRLVALSRFSRNFAMMLAAGLPITQALTLVANAVGNSYIGGTISKMRTGIERGDTLLNTAGNSGIFSPLVMQMMAVGEETGQVENLLVE
ncbi:MAG: type II secretion system F family protein, partial [Pseudomonadota bacterium]